jgi:transposase, IS30 family
MGKVKRVDYKQLSYEDRVVIERLLKDGQSQREIGRILNKGSGSISYEVRKNSVSGIYTASKANKKAKRTRWRAKEQCLKVGLNMEIQTIVREKLELKWSPDTISGYLKKEKEIICSGKAIYKFVTSRCLEAKLVFKGKTRKAKWKYIKSTPDKTKKMIESRPEILTVGHYEADFIVSKHNNSSLLVVVDKVSKRGFIWLIPDRKHATVTKAFREIFAGKKVLSLTLDNDISFSHWRDLETILDTKIFFTHPYHSWEKGLVENTNRWIRLFAPKRSDLSLITKETLLEIHNYINEKPRRILGYFTAESVYLRGNSALSEG